MFEDPRLWNETYITTTADEISNYITIRYQINGCTRDLKRETSAPEKMIIKNIIYAAMHAFKNHDISVPETLSAILDIAESTFDQFFPEGNGFDSIYIPLQNQISSPYLNETTKRYKEVI